MSSTTNVINAAQKATNFASQTVETARWEVLKEPLGFIKIIQFVMALLAFSIAVNGSSSAYFIIYCSPPSIPTSTATTLQSTSSSSSYGYILYQAAFSYPYDLKNSQLQETGQCSSGGQAPSLGQQTTITQDSQNIVSSAEFFVFTGVTAFLYSLFMGVIYVFFKHKYSNIIYFALTDFSITCLFVIFWFAGSIAWSKATSDIQTYTNPDNIISYLAVCHPNTNVCQSYSYPTYSNIIVSCILGFGNFILWTGDVWFVLKETSWYKTRQEIQRQSQNVTNNPISADDVSISASYNPNNRI